MIETCYIPGAPRLAVDVAGKGDWLFFLHGIGGNRTNWREQLDFFAARYRVAAWDARGWGGSEDYDGPLDFADFSRDLVRTMDYLGAHAAHFVGLSMGGFILQDFYPRYPERVKSMVLADTSLGPRADHGDDWIEEFLRLRRKPLLEGKTPRDIAPVVVKSLAGRHAGPAVVQRLEESIAGLRAGSYLKAMETVTRYQSSARPGDIKVPVLVLVGEDDTLTPPDASRRLCASISGATLEILPRAGHLSNIEQPELFNQRVAAFLEGLA